MVAPKNPPKAYTPEQAFAEFKYSVDHWFPIMCSEPAVLGRAVDYVIAREKLVEPPTIQPRPPVSFPG